MTKIDFKRELRHLYAASADTPVIVDVPEMAFLMVDGEGDPNLSEEYRQAVEALFSVSYALKFTLKRDGTMDYGVMPLEGLWWVDDLSTFTIEDKSSWSWTAMVLQPDEVGAELVGEAISTAAKRKPLPPPSSGWNAFAKVLPPR